MEIKELRLRAKIKRNGQKNKEKRSKLARFYFCRWSSFTMCVRVRIFISRLKQSLSDFPSKVLACRSFVERKIDLNSGQHTFGLT